MRKFLTMLAAAVAAFSLASCNKEIAEETVPSTEGIQLNITVGDLQTTDADTKAVKKGWAKGDKINIWYDDNLGQNPDLVIAYDGSKWAVDHKAAVSGNEPAASGKLVAVYVDGSLSDFTYSGEENSCTFNAPRFGSVIDDTNRPSRMPLVSHVERTDYTFASNILTANLSQWLFRGTNVQVVISGLPEGEWALSCDMFRAPNRLGISNNNPTIKVAITAPSAYGSYALSVANKDGRAFMYQYSKTDSDFKFTLFNTATSEKLVYSVKGQSLDNSGDKLNAIKIPYSKFSDPNATTGTAKRTGDIDVKWVQLWENGPKFAEYNVGAANNKAEDYGGYYAWGGSQDKVDDHNTGSVVLTGDNDTATKLWGSNWRMPTQDELKALLDNCVATWSHDKGVYGRKFTGKADPYKSNSIFLPAAGYVRSGYSYDRSSAGYYWTSVPSGSSSYYLRFDSGDRYVGTTSGRDYGRSVRAVLAE